MNGDEFLAEFSRRVNAYIADHETHTTDRVFCGGLTGGVVDALVMAKQIIYGEIGRDALSIEMSKYAPVPDAYARLYAARTVAEAEEA